MPAVEQPDGSRHRSHDFRVIADPSMIRRAVSVRARRLDARSVEVKLEAAHIGHDFPTGDMFRRIEIRAEVVDPRGGVLARARPVHLGRKFADRPAHGSAFSTERIEVEDTRVCAPGTGPARVAILRFPEETVERAVRWTVAYQRMDDAMASSFGVEQPRDEIVVDAGMLLPRTEEP